MVTNCLRNKKEKLTQLNVMMVRRRFTNKQEKEVNNLELNDTNLELNNEKN